MTAVGIYVFEDYFVIVVLLFSRVSFPQLQTLLTLIFITIFRMIIISMLKSRNLNQHFSYCLRFSYRVNKYDTKCCHH